MSVAGSTLTIMLTKENTNLWGPLESYPTYQYEKGNSIAGACSGIRCPEFIKDGYKEVVEYNNEDEDFADYCESIKKEHSDLSDKQLLENPTGIFFGRKRNARWMDEILRRNLK